MVLYIYIYVLNDFFYLLMYNMNRQVQHLCDNVDRPIDLWLL